MNIIILLTSFFDSFTCVCKGFWLHSSPTLSYVIPIPDSSCRTPHAPELISSYLFCFKVWGGAFKIPKEIRQGCWNLYWYSYRQLWAVRCWCQDLNPSSEQDYCAFWTLSSHSRPRHCLQCSMFMCLITYNTILLETKRTLLLTMIYLKYSVDQNTVYKLLPIYLIEKIYPC